MNKNILIIALCAAITAALGVIVIRLLGFEGSAAVGGGIGGAVGAIAGSSLGSKNKKA